MRSFVAAVEFLTILPIRGNRAPAQGALFFPVVGALLGAAGGAMCQSLASPLAALLTVAFFLVVTGALHEDGLADTFDAFRAGRSAGEIHAILKDSRIGTYGALALAMSLLLRWQMIGMLGDRAVAALAATLGTSRAALVALAFVSQPAGEGLGSAFCRELTRQAALGATLQGIALPFLLGLKAGCAALAANGVAVAVARGYFHRRIGGVTGDCLGALCQISEVLTLLVFTCPLFI